MGAEVRRLRVAAPFRRGRPELSAALAYYGLYPEEIDARIEEEQHWTPEKLYAEFPYLRPRRVRSTNKPEA